MEKQISSMPAIPSRWQPKYIIKRIDAEEIVIPQSTRDKILQALDKGLRFVQIGEYTVMLNAIRSIDPFWGSTNIPPRPAEQYSCHFVDEKAVRKLVNRDEIELWDKLFAERAKAKAIQEWVEK